MFGHEEAPEVELKKLFWEELSGSPFVMLGLEGVEDSRTRPMTAQIDVPEGRDKDEGGELYFFASKSESLNALAKELHEFGFWVLAVLVVGHVGAALYHHLFLDDGTLHRMLPWRRRSPPESTP